METQVCSTAKASKRQQGESLFAEYRHTLKTAWAVGAELLSPVIKM